MSPGRTPSVSLLLLLLLSLEAGVKAGIPIPQSSGCPNTEGKNLLQNVKVNLKVLNSLSPKVSSRRPSDYLNRSTSPWTLHRNEDPERYPPVIWEAQCRHQRCVNAEGKLDHHMNSVLIQQEILVLRREPENCPLTFRVEKMLVGVGCTCVSSIVRHVA
ncbi:interleukin-17A [Peromyscus californicus insignis]|uniref:interleukin-17A n=1 Tax=Peromyscus californicus insignis TaxID=564181 RepID=UPI0022A69319|nr:interleukin-17A [Peromyscus californicus insignis]